MAEELKALIDRINAEAVAAAENKARVIEEEAHRKAEEIVAGAKAETQKILSDAADRISKMEENQKEELKQTARDILIALKKEVNAMLGRLVSSHVHKALNAEETTHLITSLVKNAPAKHKEEIIISIKKEELEKVEKALLAELRQETLKGITLKPSGDIRGGFIISYDNGKSHYDFSDKAIAEYITQYIRPKLGGILNQAVKSP